MDPIDMLLRALQVILCCVLFRMTAESIRTTVVAFGSTTEAAGKLKHAIVMTLMALLVLAMASR